MKSAFIIAYKPIDYSILLGYIYKHTLYRDKFKIQAGRQGEKKMVGEKSLPANPNHYRTLLQANLAIVLQRQTKIYKTHPVARLQY